MKYVKGDKVIYLMKLSTLILTLFLVGCQNDKEDLSAFVAAVKVAKKPDIEPIPVMKTYETFFYSASELRSPFTKTIVQQTEEIEVFVDNGIYPEEHRRKEALEFYSLAELQLVGTLEKNGVWALIRSSDGVVHRVQVGNYVGQNHGKILTIGETELILKEIVPGPLGGYIERESSLVIAEVN